MTTASPAVVGALDPPGAAIPRVLAARLANMVGDATVIAICAAPEYLPVPVAVEMVAILGSDVFLFSPAGTDAQNTDIDRAITALAAGRSVVTTSTDPAVVKRLEQRLGPGRNNNSGPPARLFVIGSGMPDLPDLQPLMLGHADLVLTRDDVAAIHPPTATSPAVLHDLLEVTGGVPQFVAAALRPLRPLRPLHPNGSATFDTEDLSVAMPWAERIYADVLADPFSRLLVWAGRLAPGSLAALTVYDTEAPIDRAGLDRVLQADFVTTVPGPEPAVPALLAAALQQLWAERNPEDVRAVRGALVRAAVDRLSGLSALPGLRILTQLQAWSELDRMLTERLHLLVHLTEAEKSVLTRRWPQNAPKHLAAMATAREYVGRHELTPLERTYFFGAAVALFRLLQRSRLPLEHLGAEFVNRVGGLEQITLQPEITSILEACEPMFTWLDGLARSHPSGNNHRPDDTTLFTHLLHSSAMAWAALGRFPQARELAPLAVRLADSLDPGVELHGLLRVQALAREAFIIARGGNVDQLRSRLDELETLVQAEGTDLLTAQIIEVTRLMVGLQLGDLEDDLTLRHVDPNAFLGPERAVVTLQTIALRHRPREALGWAHQFRNEARWSDRSDWTWWQFNAAVALLHARLGQQGVSDLWRDRTTLPHEVDLFVRAGSALSAGHLDVARHLSEQILDVPDLAYRWQVLAAGIRIGADADPDSATVGNLLATIDWSTSLGTLVLLPDAARSRILPTVPGELRAGLPGLAVQHRVTAPEIPRLTKRQIEILEAMTSGESMTKVAERLFISPQTVRSSAKQIYRNLGVNDRASAIAVARALGLIG